MENANINIYQRINLVMKDVKAIQKESKKVNGQYTFVSHDAVTGALHDPMTRHGIAMIPTIGEMTQDGNRTIVRMDISFINIDKPEDKLSVSYYGYDIDTQDKGIGKAVSYAVKYALLKTFCLETGDDVEKDSIDYEPPALTKEVINKHKSELLKVVPKEEAENVGKYFIALSTTYKKPIDELVMDYKDINKFAMDYEAWKLNSAKKQSKTSVSKAA